MDKSEKMQELIELITESCDKVFENYHKNKIDSYKRAIDMCNLIIFIFRNLEEMINQETENLEDLNDEQKQELIDIFSEAGEKFGQVGSIANQVRLIATCGKFELGGEITKH